MSVLRGDDERGGGHRDVDEEDPAPAGDAEDRVGAGEEAADDRAEHGGGAEDGEEVALVLGPFSWRDDVAEDRQGEREKAARADSKLTWRASAFSGVPSWNRMSGRTFTVHWVKSSFGVTDSARYGTATPSVLYAVSVSKTELAMMMPGADSDEVVGLRPSTSASRP